MSQISLGIPILSLVYGTPGVGGADAEEELESRKCHERGSGLQACSSLTDPLILTYPTTRQINVESIMCSYRKTNEILYSNTDKVLMR